MKVYIIRHGESESNLSKCLTGWSDVSLTEKGKQLAFSISEEGMEVQERVATGISAEELAAFYDTLQKIYANLRHVADERDGGENFAKLPDSDAPQS